MEQKLRAAAAARDSKDTFLIARTDARAIHGLDEALRRAERYVKAGADGIFIEAPLTVDELARIGREVEVPQFCNMLTSGKTPILTNKELYDMGFEMVVHGITLVMKVAKTMRDALAGAEGRQAVVSERQRHLRGVQEDHEILGLGRDRGQVRAVAPSRSDGNSPLPLREREGPAREARGRVRGVTATKRARMSCVGIRPKRNVVMWRILRDRTSGGI